MPPDEQKNRACEGRGFFSSGPPWRAGQGVSGSWRRRGQAGFCGGRWFLILTPILAARALLFLLQFFFVLAFLGQFALTFLVRVIRGRQGGTPLDGWRAPVARRNWARA
jgi:hypothetical protein